MAYLLLVFDLPILLVADYVILVPVVVLCFGVCCLCIYYCLILGCLIWMGDIGWVGVYVWWTGGFLQFCFALDENWGGLLY